MIQSQEIEIVIVEDDPVHAELCITALEEKNIANTIVHLKSGREALDYLLPTGMPTDSDHQKVILLDLVMPEVDGIEVLRQIKADERTREIPVVVFTSSDIYSVERECYTLGAKDFIVKPDRAEEYKNITYKSVTGMLMYASQILAH